MTERIRSTVCIILLLSYSTIALAECGTGSSPPYIAVCKAEANVSIDELKAFRQELVVNTTGLKIFTTCALKKNGLITPDFKIDGNNIQRLAECMKKISAPQISGVQSNVYELMGNFFKYCKENESKYIKEAKEFDVTEGLFQCLREQKNAAKLECVAPPPQECILKA